MWTSAVCWKGRVPSAAWTQSVAIAVTVNPDTHLVQMDTPASVSNFLFWKYAELYVYTNANKEYMFLRVINHCVMSGRFCVCVSPSDPSLASVSLHVFQKRTHVSYCAASLVASCNEWKRFVACVRPASTWLLTVGPVKVVFPQEYICSD